MSTSYKTQVANFSKKNSPPKGEDKRAVPIFYYFKIASRKEKKPNKMFFFIREIGVHNNSKKHIADSTHSIVMATICEPLLCIMTAIFLPAREKRWAHLFFDLSFCRKLNSFSNQEIHSTLRQK